MTDSRYRQRDSLTGFNRTRLRGTLGLTMGVKSNADIFASKGDTWTSTRAEDRRAQVDRDLLEKHLREAKPNEIQFKTYLLERLADLPPVEPVKYDKQRLAEQRKPRPPARQAGKGSYVALAQKITRLAQLHKELTDHNRIVQGNDYKSKGFGHFVKEEKKL